MVEYRSVPEEGLPTFDAYLGYAFRPQHGPSPLDTDEDRVRLGAQRAVYEDGAPADAAPLCVCQHYWLQAAVRGSFHPAPGLAAVASPPEHRHGGNVRTLLRESLREYRDRGGRFSILWPFRYRYYRQFGWETAHTVDVYDCDPSALSFGTEAAPTVAFRSVDPDEYEKLDDVYTAATAGDDLRLDRSEDWWRYRVFSSYDGDRYVYAASKDGETRGYIVYTITGEAGSLTMRVAELSAIDHETTLGLLGFCHRHDSQVDRVQVPLPAGTALLDWAPDPEAIECERRTGSMVRLVDVADTLGALPSPVTDERVTITVRDELVPWNDDSFRLEFGADTVTCQRTSHPPDVEIDIGALSQLAVGYRSASDIATVGRLTGEESAIDVLGRGFPTRRVYLRDRF